MSVPNPSNLNHKNNAESATATTVSTSSNPSNSAAAVPSILHQYQKQLGELAAIQARPDENLNIIKETGPNLSQIIENCSNYFPAMADVIKNNGATTSKELAELQHKQKNGSIIYKLIASNNPTYLYLEFSEEAIANNNFLLSTKPKIYHIKVEADSTTISVPSQDVITEVTRPIICGNSALSLGNSGELRIVTTPLTDQDLDRALDAAENNECNIM